MLKFTCGKEAAERSAALLVDKLAEHIIAKEITTLAGDYFDDNLKEELAELIVEEEDGFVFDEDDQLGEESYGFVSDFFSSYLDVLSEIKKLVPSVEISGYVSVNDIGVMECVLRQGVYTDAQMQEVSFIDQLQCAHCGEWVNAADAYQLIYDEEQVCTRDGEYINMNAYSSSGDGAGFCFCSQECAAEYVDPDDEDE